MNIFENMKDAHEPIKEMLEMVDQNYLKCPWVKTRKAEQHIIELTNEIDEVKLAMEKNDMANLTEELGDVLWDAMMLIKMCKEEKGINSAEVIEIIKQKMKRRKPYVYGNEKAETPEEASIIWNRVKKEEKNQRIG